jgi:hypothetical protein
VEALAVDVGVCASHGPPGPALSPWPVYFPDVGLPGARTLESSSELTTRGSDRHGRGVSGADR